MSETTPEWTYSGDPSVSLRDEVRFLIQDTDETVPLLSDRELDYLIKKWMVLYESPIYVASVAAGIIARKFAGVTSISADGVSIQVGDLSARYVTLSERLRDEYKAEGSVGGLVNLDNILADNEWDPTIEPLEFGMRLHDNPAAGRQNFGGTRSGVPRFDHASGSWV